MIVPDVIHSHANAMVETTRARETIERARETIERAGEGARALVDALARDDDAMMRSNDDDDDSSIDDDDARRRAMERIVKRCAADARFVDAAIAVSSRLGGLFFTTLMCAFKARLKMWGKCLKLETKVFTFWI